MNLFLVSYISYSFIVPWNRGEGNTISGGKNEQRNTGDTENHHYKYRRNDCDGNGRCNRLR